MPTFSLRITLVFFVFYWHSVKILRKNGKVAEPVRGEQAGPGGARRSACVPVTCCLCRPRTGPAARARVSPPSCPAPAWTALGPRHVGLARACQGNCTKSKKERDDEYSWVLCKHVSWHLVWGKYIIPKLCFLRQSKYFTFVILKRILRNYLHNLIFDIWSLCIKLILIHVALLCFTSSRNKNHQFYFKSAVKV